MSIKFSEANSKIKALYAVSTLEPWLGKNRKIYSLDLLSGWSCPFAKDCLSKAVLKDGKRSIKDGSQTQFRCFSASQEVVYTNVYNLRENNYSRLKSFDSTVSMQQEIQDNMPEDLGICRIHVGGDFFNQNYFNAWVNIALDNPDKLFYAYTKSVRYWVNRLYDIPDNFILTASTGGREDYLIDLYKLRKEIVVFSEEEAERLGLEIDHTDEHAANPNTKHKDFALLIHGQQPKGSEASLAIKELKQKGVKFSYSNK
jgi:hypothetical protein